MPVTPDTLVRHELVGLSVAVDAAPNPDLEGIQGEVVLETTKTVGICEAPRAPESRTESGGDSGADGSERVSRPSGRGTPARCRRRPRRNRRRTPSGSPRRVAPH